MGWYFARRLLQIIPVLLGVSFVVFLLMFLVPGDAALLMLGPEGTLEDLARLRHELGLDRNFFVQFFLWLGKVLQGDLGRSFSMKTEVAPAGLGSLQGHVHFDHRRFVALFALRGDGGHLLGEAPQFPRGPHRDGPCIVRR